MQQKLYSLSIFALGVGMKIASAFHPKARLWVKGRKNTFKYLRAKINSTDTIIWMHASSLGEYEQGLPVLTALKEKYPNYKFAVSFFSPSGYEIVKNNSWTDILFYLPLDSQSNAETLIQILNPKYSIFVKYDFWYNLLSVLAEKQILTIFISAIFRENQVYFKPRGKWFASKLKQVSHFFVQDQKSEELLKSIHINQVSVSGDTRFDRVKMLLDRDNHLSWLEQFKQNSTLLIAGSTWKDDDELLVNFINTKLKSETKVLIAPHNMDQEYFKKLKSEIKTSVILFSEKEDKSLQNYQVLILDTIGILTKVYSYADIAYVGGGFGKEGVHNVLEPAVFKVPVVFGPIYSKFIEAVELLSTKGGVVINNQNELNTLLTQFIEDPVIRKETGEKAQNYILNKPNSTKIILDYFKS